MASDMKEAIAAAAKKLLMEKEVKKLTVKDIVEECRITRQAFYYHFEDIPDLFHWILERDMERVLSEVKSMDGGEARLRYLFALGINSTPYIKKGMESNYRDELERYLTEYTYRLLERLCDEYGLYQDRSRFEFSLILKYHSQAILGLMKNWTKADTENLDQIVHTIFSLMTEGVAT